MNEELFGELHEQEEYGLFGKEHERQQCFLHSVSVSLPSKPFTGEMSAFLLVNILRNLTDDQQAQLCADIYVRSSKKEYIDKRIVEMTEGNER